MKRAIIVGGSMGGMLAGNMLLRQGWTVEILEHTKGGLEARGAGIVPQRSLLAALQRAGVTVRPDIASALISASHTTAPALPSSPIITTNTVRRGRCSTIGSARLSPHGTFTRDASLPISRRRRTRRSQSWMTEPHLKVIC
jgi:2-polyprenyl-6-methoxyphenol hydroxylase-like FAD-dependent oxidoreductase